MASGVFLLVFAYMVPLEESWWSWLLRAYGLAIFLCLLLQGAVWWRGRLRDLQARRPRPPAVRLLRFDRLRRINWLLIGAFPLLVAWRRSFAVPIPAADMGWGIVLILGATLEQVNYFYYQLTYGYGLDFWYLRRHRRLRRGNIARYRDAAAEARATHEPTRMKEGTV